MPVYWDEATPLSDECRPNAAIAITINVSGLEPTQQDSNGEMP